MNHILIGAGIPFVLCLLPYMTRRGRASLTWLLATPAAMALAKRCVDEGLERDPRGALATEIMAIEESLAAAEWRKKMQDF